MARVTLETLNLMYSYPSLSYDKKKWSKLEDIEALGARYANVIADSGMKNESLKQGVGFASMARYIAGIKLNKEDLDNIKNHSVFAEHKELRNKFASLYQDKLYKKYDIDRLLNNIFKKEKISFFVPGSSQLGEFIDADPQRAFQKYLFPKLEQIDRKRYTDFFTDYDSKIKYSGFKWFVVNKTDGVEALLLAFEDYKKPLKGLVKGIYNEGFSIYKDKLVEKKRYDSLKEALEEKKTSLKKDET